MWIVIAVMSIVSIAMSFYCSRAALASDKEESMVVLVLYNTKIGFGYAGLALVGVISLFFVH